MPKEKISLNSIYISDRLQKSLQPVSNSALTAITAPMGYGEDNRRKLVSVQTGERQSGFADPDQHLLSKPFHLLGKVCKMHFPSQVLTFWKITTARKMKPPLDF